MTESVDKCSDPSIINKAGTHKNKKPVFPASYSMERMEVLNFHFLPDSVLFRNICVALSLRKGLHAGRMKYLVILK